MASSFTIKKGLDLPIGGEPEQVIDDGAAVRSVAVVGREYVGMKPTMLVAEGDRVQPGQLLFEDKKTPGVLYTAPDGGEVAAINRGARRALQSVVIRLDDSDTGAPCESFEPVAPERIAALTRYQVRDRLIRSGFWAALRTRPYSRIPAPDAQPRSIFVTAVDTDPLAADPRVVIAERPDAFRDGLRVLERLTAGRIFLCQAPGADLPTIESERLTVAEFGGRHPAGLVGTHIHFLDPVSVDCEVWHLNYQDVIAFGTLFVAGTADYSRVIALGGPSTRRPRLLRTRLGANTDDLLRDELEPVESRAISGSVLSGLWAAGWGSYLGRYHNQLSVLPEGHQRSSWAGSGRGATSSPRSTCSCPACCRRRHTVSRPPRTAVRALWCRSATTKR